MIHFNCTPNQDHEPNVEANEQTPNPAATAQDYTAEVKAVNEEDNYCVDLYQKVKANADYSNASDYEKFVLNYALRYKSEESFKAAYDRAWKAQHGILLTFEEFAAENPQFALAPLMDAYRILSKYAKDGVIKNADVYAYAKFGWCMKNPEALVAYEHDRGWELNNCGEEISKAEARIKVSEEWGFEASRVCIIGTPYYDARDWQFIRFDCRSMTWLWKNGNLYQVYD